MDECRSGPVPIAELFGGDYRAMGDVLDALGLRERLGYDFH